MLTWSLAIGGLALCALSVLLLRAGRPGERRVVQTIGYWIGMSGVGAVVASAGMNAHAKVSINDWWTAAASSVTAVYGTLVFLRSARMRLAETRIPRDLKLLIWILPLAQREALIGDICETAARMRKQGVPEWYVRVCMIMNIALSARDTVLGCISGWIVAALFAVWKLIF